ncbi:MAG: ATP-binding protein [Chitinophagaceae bacterium]|nr:MAG: ATP-binding protein [Chitinophagaceae bacterium]
MKPREISVNTALAELLLNNLFSNASRHNFSGGEINIVLHKGVLTIENTSASTGLDNQQLFRRFYNPGINKESNGLGLAVIKEICDASHVTIRYAYSDYKHAFQLTFQN